MATITVFLRKVNTRHLEQPLNVRFRHGAAGKCELVLSTGYQVPPTDLKNGRVTGTGAKKINDLLHNMQSDLEQAFSNLEQRQEPILKPAMQVEYMAVKAAREAREKHQEVSSITTYMEVGQRAAASHSTGAIVETAD